MPEGDLSRIETAILRAALDADAWVGVTQALAETFPGSRPHFAGWDSQLERTVLGAVSGYAPEFVASYDAHYGARNVHAPAWTRMKAGETAFAHEMVGEPVLLASEYYNDWLRPQNDLRGGALIVLASGRDRMFVCGAHVERKAIGSTEEPVMRALRQLGPLMQHALDVNRMTLGLRLDSAVLRLGLDPRGAALLLLSGRGTLLYANAQAEALLGEGSVLGAGTGGRLSFREASAQARLVAALRPPAAPSALSFDDGGPAPGWEVRLLPVTAEVVADLRLGMFMQMRSPRLLVALRPRRAGADEASVLMRRLGLSRAEAEIVLRMSDGATPEEIAQARGASIHTVRNQIKSALSKSDVHRQVDLVRLVGNLRGSR